MIIIPRLSPFEDGYYYMTKLSVLLSMMNIRNVYHHGTARLHPNTLYVFTYVNMSPYEWGNLGNREWRRKEIVVDEYAPRICLDINDRMEDMYDHGYYDIMIKNQDDDVVALYMAKENVIIMSDLFHTRDCYNLTVKTFTTLFKKVSELYPENVLRDTPSMYLVDLGDYVINLLDGRKYPKYTITNKIKEEVLELLSNKDKSWKTK